MKLLTHLLLQSSLEMSENVWNVFKISYNRFHQSCLVPRMFLQTTSKLHKHVCKNANLFWCMRSLSIRRKNWDPRCELKTSEKAMETNELPCGIPLALCSFEWSILWRASSQCSTQHIVSFCYYVTQCQFILHVKYAVVLLNVWSLLTLWFSNKGGREWCTRGTLH